MDGPKVQKDSILLNYTDGDICSETVRYSTIVNLKCSHDKVGVGVVL